MPTTRDRRADRRRRCPPATRRRRACAPCSTPSRRATTSMNRLMTFGLDQALAPRHRGRARAARRARSSSTWPAGPATCPASALRRGYRVVGADLSAGMLAANGSLDSPGRGRRQPPALRRRRLRRPGLRLRAAQLHRPGRHAWPSAPGCCAPAGGWPCSRSTPRLAAAGAPATTCGSPRRCPCSAAPSRTATPTATCPGRWPTCRPRPPCAGCCSTRASRPSASGPWPAA